MSSFHGLSMPYFKVNGSRSPAQYQLGALVIHHERILYELPTPLQEAQIDTFCMGDNGDLQVVLKDESQLVLQPMTRQEAARYHAAHRLQLRALQRKHAKKALEYAQAIQSAAQGLSEVQRCLQAEAMEIAGEYYEYFHTVSFELLGTNEDQTDVDGIVTVPDFPSVLNMANELVTFLEPVVSAVEPLPLPYELE